VYYRDVQFIWRLVLQLGFFATPVIYPITIIPENMQKLLLLNPMARIISMARDCTLYQAVPRPNDMVYVAASAIIILIAGYFIFDRLEPKFGESI